MKTVGNNIKVLRQMKSWSQIKTAEKLNLSAHAYAKIENGSTVITMTRVQQFVSLFEVPVNVILCLEAEDEVNKNVIIMEELRNEIAGIDKEIIKLRGTAIELYGILGEKSNF